MILLLIQTPVFHPDLHLPYTARDPDCGFSLKEGNKSEMSDFKPNLHGSGFGGGF